jgi:hypothetical protein
LTGPWISTSITSSHPTASAVGTDEANTASVAILTIAVFEKEKWSMVDVVTIIIEDNFAMVTLEMDAAEVDDGEEVASAHVLAMTTSFPSTTSNMGSLVYLRILSIGSPSMRVIDGVVPTKERPAMPAKLFTMGDDGVVDTQVSCPRAPLKARIPGRNVDKMRIFIFWIFLCT